MGGAGQAPPLTLASRLPRVSLSCPEVGQSGDLAIACILLFTFSFPNWERSKLHFFVNYPISNILLQ